MRKFFTFKKFLRQEFLRKYFNIINRRLKHFWFCIMLTGFLVYKYATCIDGAIDNNVVKLTGIQLQDLKHPSLKVDPIPQYMYEYLEQLVHKDDFTLPTCKQHMLQDKTNNIQFDMKMNFMFIKTHKCASDTLSVIFRRFALNNNLSVAIPHKKDFILGWPHTLQHYMYRPAKTTDGLHNVFLDHCIFNFTFMTSVLHQDAVYITTLREPFARLKSAMLFFNYHKRVFMPPELDIVQAFLSNMQYMDGVARSNGNIGMYACVPPGFSITQNAMAFDMGFPTGYHFHTVDQTNNYTYIKQWLAETYSQVKIMLLVEYFHESLVLLKRYMCWEWTDIFYRKTNFRGPHNQTPKKHYNKDQIQNFKQWSNVDTLLYELANGTLWKRVKEIGEHDFMDEVKAFEVQLVKVSEFCKSESSMLSVCFAGNRWQREFTLHRDQCDMIYDEEGLRSKVRDAYDATDVKVPDVMEGHTKVWC